MAYTPLKLWFNKDLAILLAEKIQKEYKSFPKELFVQTIEQGCDELELKDRIKLIARSLRDSLPESYLEALKILLSILGPENPDETGMFTKGYWIWPIADFIEMFGLDHPTESLAAIGEVTKRCTGEYAIRPYLRNERNMTMQIVEQWARSENLHLRRLSSEGLRPRLPWASKLDFFIDDPHPIFPVLEILMDDSSKFVQKSVANNLNDISKDNPEVLLDRIEPWLLKAGPERKWIIKHGLRTLRKKNDPRGLEILSQL